jgi:hypothetical protein
MMTEFPRVTRERLKEIGTDTADGLITAPTEEEKKWLDIIKSTAPEHEKLRKKLSVCALADVVSYSSDEVTISYDDKQYTIKKPANSLRIARAHEYSIIAALEELNGQRCIVSNGVPIAKDFTGIDVEVIQILATVAENFFFTPFL